MVCRPRGQIDQIPVLRYGRDRGAPPVAAYATLASPGGGGEHPFLTAPDQRGIPAEGLSRRLGLAHLPMCAGPAARPPWPPARGASLPPFSPTLTVRRENNLIHATGVPWGGVATRGGGLGQPSPEICKSV